MTIQELIDRAKRADQKLTIQAYDNTSYEPLKSAVRRVHLNVWHETYGEGSHEGIELVMSQYKPADQVLSLKPGRTMLHWQVAPFMKVLDADTPHMVEA